MKVLESGNPQGSNLGTLLFLLYLNDMSRSFEVLNFVNFADDTTVFLSHPNLNALYTCFNEELSKVTEGLRFYPINPQPLSNFLKLLRG